MAQSKSEKFLPKKDITQTSAHIGLVAQVSTDASFMLFGSNLQSIQSCRYSAEDAVGDLVAGITVGLTVIPQALAYSGIAGLAPAVSEFHWHKYPILFWSTDLKNFILSSLCDLVWPIRLIHGVLCVHHIRLKQRRTDGTNSNRITAHISSGRRCMATGCSSIIFNWRHWDADGSTGLGLSHQFRVRAGELRIYECRSIDNFDVTS